MGVPWWSSGWDSVLRLPRARVQSLVGELGSHKPHSVAKKKIKINKINKRVNFKKKINLKSFKLHRGIQNSPSFQIKKKFFLTCRNG